MFWNATSIYLISFFPKMSYMHAEEMWSISDSKSHKVLNLNSRFLQLSYHLTHHMNLEYRLINLRLRSTPNPQKFYQVAGHMSSRRQHSCAVSAEEYLALSFWDWLALGRIQVSGGRLSIHLTSLSSCSNDASWQ